MCSVTRTVTVYSIQYVSFSKFFFMVCMGTIYHLYFLKMNIRIWNTENVSVVGVLDWVFSTWEHYRWKNILQSFLDFIWNYKSLLPLTQTIFWQCILYKLLFIIFSRYMLRNRSKPRGKFQEQDVHETDMELDARMLWYFRNKKKTHSNHHTKILAYWKVLLQFQLHTIL